MRLIQCRCTPARYPRSGRSIHTDLEYSCSAARHLPHADLRRLLQGTVVLALALLVGSEACSQDGGAVAGTVVSTWDGTPLPSIAVSVRGTTLATQTDASGK